MNDPTDDDERLAEELVNEALAGLAPLMTDGERSAVRELLVDELLFTDAGRLRLKAAAPQPIVDQSGEVGRGEPAKKAGSSS